MSFFSTRSSPTLHGVPHGSAFPRGDVGEKPTENYQFEWIMQHANRWQKDCMNETRTQFPKHLVEHASPRLRKSIEYLHSRGF